MELLTPELLDKLVEDIIYKSDDQVTHVEAVLEVAASRGLDEEGIAGVLSASLKAKIQEDFERANMLPKTSKLDF